METDSTRLWMTADVLAVLEDAEVRTHVMSRDRKQDDGSYGRSATPVTHMPDISLLEKRAEKFTAWYDKAIGVYTGEFPMGTGLPKRAARMNAEVLRVAVAREKRHFHMMLQAHKEQHTPTTLRLREIAEARWRRSTKQLDALVAIYLGSNEENSDV